MTFWVNDQNQQGPNNIFGYTLDLLDANQQVVASNFQFGQEVDLAGRGSSYAINNNITNNFRTLRSDKILFVEYHKVIADVVGPNASDNWPDWVAPRHEQSLNVLYGDGRVELHIPENIDPRISRIHDFHWQYE